MIHDDDEFWKHFTMTGKIEDYLKYRFDDVAGKDKELFKTDNDMSVAATVYKEKYDERDIYGDGDGDFGPARGRI